MPCGATQLTVQTYRAHAERLVTYAADLADPLAKTQFLALAAEWAQLTVLAEWQVIASAEGAAGL